MKLDLPDIPPSPNRLRGVHWGKKRQIAEYWKSLVRSAAKPGHTTEKRRVRITIHHAREYDQDNAYAACKPLIDALTFWSHIIDDSAKWLELNVEQAKCKHKERHTVVEVE